MTDAETPVQAFVEASSLHQLNATAFGSRIGAFDPPPEGVAPFSYPAAVQPLRPVNDRTQRLLGARRSGRSFGTSPLTEQEVTRILAAVGADEGGRPVVPSAGDLRSIQTFGLALATEGPTAGQVFRYDTTGHAIQPIIATPEPTEVRRLFLLDCDGDPQLIVLFVADLRRVIAKYGDRGGRFIFQEAGHAAQNVGLRLAADRLTGYVLGGALDQEVLSVLGLAGSTAVVAGAIACGRAPAAGRRIRK